MKYLILFLILIPLFSYSQVRVPVLFDDFDYTSIAPPKEGSDTNSIFGYNPWLTHSGCDTAKAWFRWNTGDPAFGENSYIKLTEEGFILGLSKGNHNTGHFPMIHSSFRSKHGTFASRIKFGKLNMDDKITHAYWLIGSFSFNFYDDGKRIFHYTDEVDFEWNNWWYKPRRRAMSTGGCNRNYLDPQSTWLDCFLKANDKYIPCNCDSEINGAHVIAGQWATAIISIDTLKETVEFSIRIDDLNETGQKIYAGKVDKGGQFMPFTIDYEPYYNLITVFSVGPRFDEGNILHNDSKFEIDWFLYSPQPGLDFDDIEFMVDHLKENDIRRINTTAVAFQENVEDIKDNIYLDGPAAIYSCEKSKYIIRERGSNISGHFRTFFKYRFHNISGRWEEWTDHYSVELDITPGEYHDSLEIFLNVEGFWSKFMDTVNIIVPVLEGNCPRQAEFQLQNPVPNPASSVSVAGFDLYNDMNINLILCDATGKLIYDLAEGFHKKGSYSLTLDTDPIGTGIYYLVLITEHGTTTKPLVVWKNIPFLD